MLKINDKWNFLFRNLLKGIFWLALIMLIYMVVKNRIDLESSSVIDSIQNSPVIVLLVYIFSEVAFGIIPPEFFMIWSFQYNNPLTYGLIILLLAVISYLAGIMGYWIGAFFNRTRLYRFIYDKFLKKYQGTVNRFGLYLIAVASLTPLPFSAVCMIVGSAKYPFRKFLLYACFRFLRFGLYSFLIWQANIIG
ncbi:MAG: VTT domain-containing protein [Bacteroidetes bacterium]|nr:VTT domain-containing protein [Bacteroidota bacterium]